MMAFIFGQPLVRSAGAIAMKRKRRIFNRLDLTVASWSKVYFGGISPGGFFIGSVDGDTHPSLGIGLAEAAFKRPGDRFVR